MKDFWDRIIWDNTVRDWAIALGIILVAFTLLRIIQSLIIRKVRQLTTRTKSTLDDFIIAIIQSSVMPLLYVLAVYFGLKYIRMSERAGEITRVAILLVNCFFILRIITSFIGYGFRNALSGKDGNAMRQKQARGILLIVQAAVWLIGILFLIDNLGYDITTLVAGLGIGGIAIALAAQTILGDLFSYLVIFFDKPFEIGDFIIVEDKMGTIEYIGIKTTRLRTLDGEQLICSNTDLTNSRVHNYKRMQERRVAFTLGVLYDTPPEKLRSVPGLVEDVVRSVKEVRFDRAHFSSFGDSSLNFEIVYYVLSPDYTTYMDRQQEINFSVYEAFSREEIGFAFPTQTLHIAGLERG
jgi:small-conductance mechanosensitive channel